MALKDKLELEKQWVSTTSYRRLLNHMRVKHDIGQTKLGRRKLRLFACGACRLMLWDDPVPERFKKMVDAAEAFADDRISKHALARRGSEKGEWPKPMYGHLWLAATAMRATTEISSVKAANRTAYDLLQSLEKPRGRGGKGRLCRVVREVFGNPFHVTVIEDSLLSWRDATIPQIAAKIYEERRFGDLPILADALEEAGCADAEILSHCREPGEHVLGCWVVDLLLGKDYRK